MNTPDNVIFSTYEHAEGNEIAINRFTSEHTDNTPHIMFCGGFHSSMSGTKATELLTFCQSKQWHFTRFDYQAHGQSGGDASTLSLTDWLNDTLAVLDDSPQPTLMIGSSMGAWLATLAALRRPDTIKGLLLLAAAPDFLQELVAPKLTASHEWDLQQGQGIFLDNAYDNPFPITQTLLDSGKTLSLLDKESLDAMHCPVRLIHGTRDTDVPYSLSARLMDKLPEQHDARLNLLHGADHRLSDERCLSYIRAELEAMIEQLFPSQ